MEESNIIMVNPKREVSTGVQPPVSILMRHPRPHRAPPPPDHSDGFIHRAVKDTMGTFSQPLELLETFNQLSASYPPPRKVLPHLHIREIPRLIARLVLTQYSGGGCTTGRKNHGFSINTTHRCSFLRHHPELLRNWGAPRGSGEKGGHIHHHHRWLKSVRVSENSKLQILCRSMGMFAVRDLFMDTPYDHGDDRRSGSHQMTTSGVLPTGRTMGTEPD
ncbi:hypothetical protein ASPBRDRAFT_51661 [Aspergillus brasiliensis CBS 101740]|uniref:Uncharacterized protein n=1 Tax=Aspergillus brasiliensis (strain CBS 101740 / IMI 381727 / IBT 21946) TaxID=767769 RepID=A0A1L9UWH3_ASPBC|nr:hypothetical protein ASPBRDRAFT_51661 [Aspergillus brasiliensis CBS 101740]